MKERIWLVYYWAMISYLVITLLVLIVSLLSWNDREYVDGEGSKGTYLCVMYEKKSDNFNHLEVCKRAICALFLCRDPRVHVNKQ